MKQKANHHFTSICSKQMLYQLVDFQCRYYAESLSSEERYREGCLPYILPYRSLVAAQRINLLQVAVNRKYKPIGFACGLSPLMAKHVEYLRPLAREYSVTKQYPVFISLCVERQHRDDMKGTVLIYDILEEARRQGFLNAVIDLGKGNLKNQEFLRKRNFIQQHIPLLNDRVIYINDLKKTPH